MEDKFLSFGYKKRVLGSGLYVGLNRTIILSDSKSIIKRKKRGVQFRAAKEKGFCAKTCVRSSNVKTMPRESEGK